MIFFCKSVRVCVSVCVTEIEIKCRDNEERLGSVGTESSSSSSVATQYSHVANRWHSSVQTFPP